MFGNPLRIEYDGFGITLRLIREDEIPHLTDLLQSFEVRKYTNMYKAPPSLANELEWWKKSQSDPDSAVWGIVPDGVDCVIGVTSLHGLQSHSGTSSSGIIIADKAWWRKGIASRAHLGRTLEAVATHNRSTIQSTVRAPNEASLKALLTVGYAVTGCQPYTTWVDDQHIHTYSLIWTNPYHLGLLCPNGLANCGLPAYVVPNLEVGIQKARAALEKAKQVVTRM